MTNKHQQQSCFGPLYRGWHSCKLQLQEWPLYELRAVFKGKIIIRKEVTSELFWKLHCISLLITLGCKQITARRRPIKRIRSGDIDLLGIYLVGYWEMRWKHKGLEIKPPHVLCICENSALRRLKSMGWPSNVCHHPPWESIRLHSKTHSWQNQIQTTLSFRMIYCIPVYECNVWRQSCHLIGLLFTAVCK